MQPKSRRTFAAGWTAGALLVLCVQIVALSIPPATSGTQHVILIGPAAVVRRFANRFSDSVAVHSKERHNGRAYSGKAQSFGQTARNRDNWVAGFIPDDIRLYDMREFGNREDRQILKLNHHRQLGGTCSALVAEDQGIRKLKDSMAREILDEFDHSGLSIASGTCEVVGFPD